MQPVGKNKVCAPDKDKFGLKLFKQLVDHLWKNRELLFNKNFLFDYPDYAGLPKQISQKLTTIAIDIIQEIFYYQNQAKFTQKSQLEKALKRALFPLAD
jgi:hypothetical protein